MVDKGTDVQSHSKRPRTVSPPLFGSQDPTPTYRSGSSAMGQETKKLIISTCRAIVKLESNLTKLEAKSSTLEQHRLNGTVPKDLLLPKKKLLFVDEQSKVDDILQTASNALLAQRIAEISRKKSELLVHKTTLEKDMLKTLESSRDSQLKFVSPENREKITIIMQRHGMDIHNFYSHLALSRENAFIKATRAAEKEAKKKMKEDTAMDTSPDVRVIDVLDQRLEQLGLIGRKFRSSSPGSQKSRNCSSSGISYSSFSDSSHSSSHSSRGLSRSNLKRKSNTHEKKVKFESQKLSKNGGPTTPPHQRRKGRGNRGRRNERR